MDPSVDLFGAQTPAMLEAVATMRARLQDDSMLAERQALVTDFTLLRFLRARQGKIQEALQFFMEHKRWEIEVNIEQIASEGPLPEAARIAQLYPHCYHGVDRFGRPVSIERLGMLDARSLMGATTQERFARNFIWEHEHLLRHRLPACSVAAGRLVHRIVKVVDAEGLSFSTVADPQGKVFLQAALKIAQDHYPEIMAATVIVNAPRLFSLVWQALRPLLHPCTTAKIKIVGQDPRQVKKELFQLIAPEELPQFLGGECRCEGTQGGCMHSDRGPWKDQAILARILPLPYHELIQRYAEGKGPETVFQQNDMPSGVGQCAPPKPVHTEVAASEPIVNTQLPTVNEEAQRLLQELGCLEQTHMETLESWLLEAASWERKLGLSTLAREAPRFEAEHRHCLAEQRTAEAEAHWRQLCSEQEDLEEILDTLRTRLEVLERTSQEHSGTHRDTLSQLEEQSRLAAATRSRRDAAAYEHQRLILEVHSLHDAAAAASDVNVGRSSSYGRLTPLICVAASAAAGAASLAATAAGRSRSKLSCRPYFEAKWRHENHVMGQVKKINALRAELAALHVDVPFLSGSTADFEFAGKKTSTGLHGTASSGNEDGSECPPIVSV